MRIEQPHFTTRAPRDVAGWADLFDHTRLPVLASTAAALEDLRTPVEGVVTTYTRPFTAKDHEAITANIPVFGEVKGQRVVYAYPDDLKKASQVRLKDASAKGALAVKK